MCGSANTVEPHVDDGTPLPKHASRIATLWYALISTRWWGARREGGVDDVAIATRVVLTDMAHTRARFEHTFDGK